MISAIPYSFNNEKIPNKLEFGGEVIRNGICVYYKLNLIIGDCSPLFLLRRDIEQNEPFLAQVYFS
jgi:hypothetical protein